MTVQFSEHSATGKGLVTPNHCPWDPGGSEPKGLNDSEVAKTETFLGLPGGATNRIGGGGVSLERAQNQRRCGNSKSRPL